MRFVSALRLRVSAFQGKPWPIVEEKNKLRNQQKKNQEEQAKEKADWNCEKSGKIHSVYMLQYPRLLMRHKPFFVPKNE